jgi:hypothetical protein
MAQGGDSRASMTMKQIIRLIDRQVAFELRLGYLMPIFVGLGILLNAQIANAHRLDLEDFAPVVVRARQFANYSRDAINLQFAPLDPGIIEIALADLNLDKDGLALDDPVVISPTPDQAQGSPTPTVRFGSPTPSSSPQPTATSLLGLPTLPLPTLPPLLPTLPPLLPTLPPLLPTLPPVVPTLVPIVPTLVPIVPTAVAPVIGVIPTVVPNLPCIPIPLIRSCN